MIPPGILELVRLLMGAAPVTPKSVIIFEKPVPVPLLANCKAINDPALKMPGIRWCCALPVQSTSVISQAVGGTPSLKPHAYNDGLTSSDDSGYIYSKYGGIIDLGHVRDNADWTRYFITQVVRFFNAGKTIDIPDDSANSGVGRRRLTIHPQGSDPTPYKAALIGAYINFQLAVWHEISTFDDFSCYSPEDNYSNLLGTYVGYKACLDAGVDYNPSVTKNILDVLATLETQETTISTKAMEHTENVWYSGITLLKHHLQIQPILAPWLITEIKTVPLPAVLNTLAASRPIFNTNILLPVDEDGSSLEKYFAFEVVDPVVKSPISLSGALDASGRILDSKKFQLVTDRIRTHYKTNLGTKADQPD